MTDREKLINLLCHIPGAEEIADFFLANGVTFAKDTNVPSKWIPVSERLPEDDGRYLVYKVFGDHGWHDVHGFAKDGRKVDEYDFQKRWKDVWFNYDSEYGYITYDSVTHWMPLLQPPQEVSNET